MISWALGLGLIIKYRLYKIISVILISSLLVSLGSINIDFTTFEFSFHDNSQTNILEQDQYKNNLPKPILSHKILLFDSVIIKSYDENNKKIILYQKPISHKLISLYENISIKSNDSKNNLILFVKQNSDLKAMMERISFQEKKKLNNVKDWSKISLVQVLYENTFNDNPIVNDWLNSLEEVISVNYKPMIVFFVNTEKFSSEIFDTENPFLLLLIMPFAGYILCRTENEKLFQNTKPVLSYSLVFLSSLF